jgi:ribonuclease T2
MTALARTPLTAGGFAQAFAAANPGMRPDMVNLNLDRDNWLREVWLCLDTRFRREKCKAPLAADRAVRIRLPG